MKKIISLMVLLLMIATVSALTENRQFTTYINVTNNGSQIDMWTAMGKLDTWICSNGTVTGNNYNNYPINFWENIEIGDTTHLANLTDMMKELTEVSLQLATYGNDSKNYQTLYNEKNEAWARLNENYDDCKEDRDTYKNDSIQLTAYQNDLADSRRLKSDCDTKFSICDTGLTDQKAKTQTTGVICLLIGAAVGYGFFWYKKEYVPAEKRSFQ